MIKELKNKNLFHKDNELFKKYFIEKAKSKEETANTKKLSDLVLSFYQKIYDKDTKYVNYNMFDYDFCTYGYLENYGYYIINYDTHNYYFVAQYDEISEAFVALIRIILNKKSQVYEQANRRNLKQDFKKRFPNVKYDKFFCQYEYELNKWSEYFDGNIPQELINKYNAAINYFNITDKLSLVYDPLTKKFIEKSGSLTRKLSK